MSYDITGVEEYKWTFLYIFDGKQFMKEHKRLMNHIKNRSSPKFKVRLREKDEYRNKTING